jgi:hypothetical protein
MKILPIGKTTFDFKSIKNEVDLKESNIDELFVLLQLREWKNHSTMTFYIDLPDEAVDILTNSNLFVVEHRRGLGILTGTVSALESFVLKNATMSNSIKERFLANVFHHMLKVHFGMFKEHSIKQLADQTYTVTK